MTIGTHGNQCDCEPCYYMVKQRVIAALASIHPRVRYRILVEALADGEQAVTGNEQAMKHVGRG